MHPRDFPTDLPFEEVVRMIAEHKPCPELEETKILVREELEKMELEGDITREHRLKLLAILGTPLTRVYDLQASHT